MFLTRLSLYARNLSRSNSSLRWRLISGVLWVLVAAVASQASGFLRAILPARILGIDAYGQFVVIQSTLMMLASFAGLGLGTTATRYVSQLRQTDPVRAGRILGFCNLLTLVTAGLFSAILLSFAEVLSSGLFGSNQLAPELRIGSLFVFFFTLNGYQVGALAGFEAFSALAWATVLQSALSIAIMWAFTWLWKLSGAILALGIIALVAWIIQGITLRQQCRIQGVRISYSNVFQERQIFREFALPAALSGILGGTVTAGGNALLVRQPNGLAQAAIFGAATTIRTIALFAPGVMTRVTLPVLSNLQGGQLQRSYRKTFWAGLLLSSGFALVAAVILYWVTPLLLHLFGKGFVWGNTVVAIALASAVLEVIAVNLFQVLYSHGRVWTHLAISAVWAAIVLGVTMQLAPQYGATALAFSYLLAWASSVLLYGFVVKGVLPRSSDDGGPSK